MHHFRKSQNQKGFTMIELMVVVVIVGILAAIAIPLYGKYVKNAKTTEATGRMGEIITAQKAYAMENGLYTTATAGVVDLRDSDKFEYTWAGTDTANDATVTAEGISGTDMEGVTIEISGINMDGSGSPPQITGL
jgi:prepilin-type N-terminal cleavage/methylation domain-containing protein